VAAARARPVVTAARPVMLGREREGACAGCRLTPSSLPPAPPPTHPPHPPKQAITSLVGSMYVPASALLAWLEGAVSARLAGALSYVFGSSPLAAAVAAALQAVLGAAAAALQPLWSLVAVAVLPAYWLARVAWAALRLLALPFTWVLGGLGGQLLEALGQFGGHLAATAGAVGAPLGAAAGWAAAAVADALVALAAVAAAVLRGPAQVFLLLRTSLVQLVILPWQYAYSAAAAVRVLWATVSASAKVAKSAAPAVASSAKAVRNNWFVFPLTLEAVDFVRVTVVRVWRAVRAVAMFLLYAATSLNQHRRSLMLQAGMWARGRRARLARTRVGAAAVRLGSALLPAADGAGGAAPAAAATEGAAAATPAAASAAQPPPAAAPTAAAGGGRPEAAPAAAVPGGAAARPESPQPARPALAARPAPPSPAAVPIAVALSAAAAWPDAPDVALGSPALRPKSALAAWGGGGCVEAPPEFVAAAGLVPTLQLSDVAVRGSGPPPADAAARKRRKRQALRDLP